jgi:hypothetical protein
VGRMELIGREIFLKKKICSFSEILGFLRIFRGF